jgi:hypothetical protein
LDDRPCKVPEVVSRNVDQEAVLVHPGQNKVRVLNAVGARLWELADGQHTVGEMARVVADEYAVDVLQVQSDAMLFCQDLVDRGLLSLDT